MAGSEDATRASIQRSARKSGSPGGDRSNLHLAPPPTEDPCRTTVRRVAQAMENDYALHMCRPDADRDWALAWHDVISDLRRAVGMGECTKADSEMAAEYGWDDPDRPDNIQPWVVFDWAAGVIRYCTPATLGNAANEAAQLNDESATHHSAERFEVAHKLANAFRHGVSFARAEAKP